MTETMRREGHKALVAYGGRLQFSGRCSTRSASRTTSASSTIVRSKEQADILHEIGAKHVVDFDIADLHGRPHQRAGRGPAQTIAFDAIGGGRLAGQILTGMETAINKTAKVYSRYGSSVHKQVYIYGSLDPPAGGAETGAFGMAWGVGGWLAVPVPDEDRAGPTARSCAEPRGRRAQDDILPSHYTKSGVAAGGVGPLEHRRLRQGAPTGEKFSDQSEQGRMKCR